MDKIKQWSENRILSKISAFVEGAFFPLALGAAVLFLYILNLPIVILALLAVCGSYICLFASDTRAGLAVLAFTMITFRYKDNGGAYLSTGAIVVYALFGGVLLFSAAYRLLFRRAEWKNKRGIIGVFCLGFTILFGGIFTKYYTAANFAQGLGLAGSLFLSYAFFALTMHAREDNLLYFARMGAIVICIISVQLGEFYLRVYEKGTPLDWVWKERIILGWSISNMAGEMIAVLIPALFYLIYKEKRGYYYWLVLAVGLVGVYFTYSRNALLWSGISVLTYSLVNCFIGENKKIHRIVVGGAILAVAAVVLVLWAMGCLKGLLRFFLETGFSDRTRFKVWREHIKLFQQSPVQGVGLKAFYDIFHWREHYAHNNLLQMLTSAGVLGLILYLAHRVQTLCRLFKKRTVSRMFVGGCLFVCIGVGIVSSIFFHTYFLCYYGMILLVLDKSLEANE